MNVPTAVPHRERLLREGLRQLYARGFHGTTVDAILEASGVPKGSFYHHFGSKETFAREVLARYLGWQLDLLQRWVDAEELSTGQAVAGYFREMADRFVRTGHNQGCLFGKLSTEVAVAHVAFREQLSADIARWKQRVEALLERGRVRGDVRTDLSTSALADAVLALVQGAFVIALASRDDASLDAVCATLELLVSVPA